MSFKVKNSQLNNESLECLNSLIGEDINASAAFKITRILKFISGIVEDRLNSEKRIFEKYAQRDEQGQPLRAKTENGDEIEDTVMLSDLDSFSKEMSELLNVENEIPYDKVDFSELGLTKAKIKDLLKIEFLFS